MINISQVYWEALLDLAEEEEGSQAKWQQPESLGVAWLWILADPQNVWLYEHLSIQ